MHVYMCTCICSSFRNWTSVDTLGTSEAPLQNLRELCDGKTNCETDVSEAIAERSFDSCQSNQFLLITYQCDCSEYRIPMTYFSHPVYKIFLIVKLR